MVDKTFVDEIPVGWEKLFFQMCDDIDKVLSGTDTFEFIQVKEKYGQLRVYFNCSNSAVDNIVDKYEHISQYICAKCGGVATKQNLDGWICPYCDKCYDGRGKVAYLQFDPKIRYARYCRGDTEYSMLDCSDEWRRYLDGK